MIREIYVFFAKMWFVKTSTRIVKCESRVVKSNPVHYSCILLKMVSLKRKISSLSEKYKAITVVESEKNIEARPKLWFF